MVGEDLICKCRVFQSLGATTEKALSPLVLRSVLGIQRRFWDQDLIDLGALYGINRSPIYLGAKPLITCIILLEWRTYFIPGPDWRSGTLEISWEPGLLNATTGRSFFFVRSQDTEIAAGQASVASCSSTNVVVNFSWVCCWEKSILKQTGSQCRDSRTGVIWSYTVY